MAKDGSPEMDKLGPAPGCVVVSKVFELFRNRDNLVAVTKIAVQKRRSTFSIRELTSEPETSTDWVVHPEFPAALDDHTWVVFPAGNRSDTELAAVGTRWGNECLHFYPFILRIFSHDEI